MPDQYWTTLGSPPTIATSAMGINAVVAVSEGGEETGYISTFALLQYLIRILRVAVE